ncbi:MAG: sn-glycerol-3-phosphate ABC transporter substrate-binding protein UgpB [Acidihalobacter sp.]|uniref:sn-glycerol-3-phosphate ABC transporter substrate-binding protein UgpB n=1 Tax=Acidihalobacter sp. TaxID=1872108 RepID=UPI00307E009E
MSNIRRKPDARRLAGVASGLLALSTVFAAYSAHAADRVKIQFWNAMSGKLGETVQHLADEFNQSQNRYEVVPVFKGTYKETMLSAIAAFRAHNPPDIVQIFDVGTATMMSARGAYVPVYNLMAKEHIAFSTKQFIPAAASYYSNTQGKLVSLPFNSSTPVIFYNKDLFAKAGVQPPKTWAEMDVVGKKLRASGAACGFTTGWPAWVQMEQFSLWNGLHYATHDNGYKAVKGVKLLINDKPYVEHLAQLGEWSKSGVFEYGGPESNSRPLFVSGHCAMYMGSSASYAAIKGGAQFPFGIGPMPYDGKLADAPQNTVVGGASLWVMKGVPSSHYAGIAAFLKFMMSGKSQAYWASSTGYVPVTQAGYQQLKSEGFYNEQPGAMVAIDELSNKAPKPWTMGIRLGYMPQIRQVERNEMEAVFAGHKSAQTALDEAKRQGDVLLQQFTQSLQH